MDDDYRIILQPEAYEGMENAYVYLEEQSPKRAAEWVGGLMKAIQSLTTFPNRCALAPENDRFPVEIRQLLYGKRGSVYRILFTVQEEVVSILYIRHSLQEVVEPEVHEE